MNKFKIIEARKEYIETIAEIYIGNWKETYAPLLTNSGIEKLTIDYGMQTWKDFLKKRYSKINVVKIKGETVGFIATSPDININETIYVDSLHVSKKARGLGVGTLLLKEILANANSTNQNVSICIIKGNDSARRLYMKLRAKHHLDFEDNINNIITQSEKLLWNFR